MNDRQPYPASQGDPLKRLLQTESAGRLQRRWPWVVGALMTMVGIGLLFLRSGDHTAVARYQTEAATIGTLVVTVSATGKLQPTNQVDVGSELSGIVEQVYVDVNDRVQKGEILARLDLSKLRDTVAKSRANLAAAQAQVLQTQATVAEARAVLARYHHVSLLSGGKVPSKNEMDIAEATLQRAEANQASAGANVSQAQAQLQSDETNLAKASLRSPINGVVLARQVEPGQTVAASFQAPVLFTLAEDLAQMELQVDVDEADVGQVEEGQQATFTVDAWPRRIYEALITRVGYGAQEKDGVVSYLTVLAVGNDDLSLRPGMTGTAEITTLVREKALLVPNAALRFSPPTTPTPTKKPGTSVVSALLPRPPRPAPKTRSVVSSGSPRVWVLRENQPVAIDVQTGATNGRVTEILGGAIEAGTPVITETLN